MCVCALARPYCDTEKHVSTEWPQSKPAELCLRAGHFMPLNRTLLSIFRLFLKVQKSTNEAPSSEKFRFCYFLISIQKIFSYKHFTDLSNYNVALSSGIQAVSCDIYTGVLIGPQPDQEGNKLQRQKILSFIHPIYNHNWRNMSTICIQSVPGGMCQTSGECFLC